MIKVAADENFNGKIVPGLFQVDQSAAINQVIEDVLLLALCSFEGEWEGQIRYLPL